MDDIFFSRKMNNIFFITKDGWHIFFFTKDGWHIFFYHEWWMAQVAADLAVIAVTWARILKHLLEAEKSTFRKELSFQRSESTIGLLQATVFVYERKDSFLWI